MIKKPNNVIDTTNVDQDYSTFGKTENLQSGMTDDEKIMLVAQRILRKHINAFKELAK